MRRQLILGGFLLLGALVVHGAVTPPIESCDYKELTGHATMMSWLAELTAEQPWVQMDIIGRSVEGREIPALFFSGATFGQRRADVPVVMVFCQQHGNEPSGKEAALILARDLTADLRPLLESIDVILIPMANPDGSEAEQRRNARDMDLNRNHVILSEPEVQAIHRVFRRWMPEITLDVHEYNAVSRFWIERGYVRNADEMLGGVTNLNISLDILSFSRETIFPAVRDKVAADGFICERYVVGSPFAEDRLRYSTTDINDGRQSLGIYNTLSFILEGKRYGDLTNRLGRRVRAQVSAIRAFLSAAAAHASSALALIRRERAALLAERPPDDRALVQMDYGPDPARPTLAMPVFNVFEWREEVREFDRFEPLVRVKKSVPRPLAYLIPAAQSGLLELLQRHEVELQVLTADIRVKASRYRVLHLAERHEEEQTKPAVDLTEETGEFPLEEGDVVVFTRQPAALLLPLLLEPESTWGVCTDTGGVASPFADYLAPGETYPVYRLMEPAELPLRRQEQPLKSLSNVE
jgi:hypothetical protein